MGYEAPRYPARGSECWLGNLDSNQDKQSQSLLCYRYTIPQGLFSQFNGLRNWPAIAPETQIAAHRLAAVLLVRRGAWQGCS